MLSAPASLRATEPKKRKTAHAKAPDLRLCLLQTRHHVLLAEGSQCHFNILRDDSVLRQHATSSADRDAGYPTPAHRPGRAVFPHPVPRLHSLSRRWKPPHLVAMSRGEVRQDPTPISPSAGKRLYVPSRIRSVPHAGAPDRRRHGADPGKALDARGVALGERYLHHRPQAARLHGTALPPPSRRRPRGAARTANVGQEGTADCQQRLSAAGPPPPELPPRLHEAGPELRPLSAGLAYRIDLDPRWDLRVRVVRGLEPA